MPDHGTGYDALTTAAVAGTAGQAGDSVTGAVGGSGGGPRAAAFGPSLSRRFEGIGASAPSSLPLSHAASGAPPPSSLWPPPGQG